jgi:hypothetical protein
MRLTDADVDSNDTSIEGTATLIAAMAKSQRASLMRRMSDPVTCGDLANLVEIIELLANDLADVARRRGR